MVTKKNNIFRGTNLLLWIGLGMVGAAIVLMLVGALLFGSGTSRSTPFSSGAPATTSNAASISAAREAVEQVLENSGNSDLEVAEMMEFTNNYYALVREKSTGIGAMELLVDKPSGWVHPEPGPNMMWNTKYGMMAGGQGMMGPNSGGMMGAGGPEGGGMMGGFSQPTQASPNDVLPISPDDATQIAKDYISRNSLGTDTEKPDQFYGYYTLHTLRNGEVNGMLSVNGYTGAVWYHNWHGPFIAMEEEEESE